VTPDERRRYRAEYNREPVPCASDEHKFRPEVYDALASAMWIEQECCTICGWSWGDIADHDRGDCCCPGEHRTPRLKI
jgi:hypothetical protein